MNTTSLNNLWTYLNAELTASDWAWLKEKMLQSDHKEHEASAKLQADNLRISQRRRKLMGSVRIDPHDVADDERAKYILNK